MIRRQTLTVARLGLILLAFVLVAGFGIAAENKPMLEVVNRLARDIRLTREAMQQVEPGSKAEFSAMSKEAATADEMKRVVSRLGNADEIRAAIEELQQFSYRMSTIEENKAFHQAVQVLEDRCKFLARAEDPGCRSLVDQLDRLRTEIDGKVAKGMLQGVRERVTQHLDTDAPVLSVDTASTDRAATPPRRSTPRTGVAAIPVDLLGANVKGGKTEFSVYSGAATAVNLVLFAGAADKNGKAHPMTRGNDGIWRISMPGDLSGKFYGFTADGPKAPGHLFDPARLLSDPYAKANVDHDGKSIVINDVYTWKDAGFKPPAMKDLIIYEVHVKDFTAHASSGVPAAHRGKYLGMLHGANTDKVLGHLVDLGVNAVELLPIHEFDNNFAGHPNHWGYMTSHFFAPESGHASGKNGQAVREFKQLVDGLHQAGIAVILDVVFNHTAEGDHRGMALNFKGLDNPAYYRLCDNPIYYWNGTGCGNEFRSDSAAGRKLILDSLKYWVNEYHVDGFRFDLGTIIDKETMNAMMRELPPHIILVSEPWAADWKRNQWGKSDFRNTRLGKWNDDFRENVRAFAKGQGDRNNLMTVLAGSCFWWAAKPTESLNYVECHDGATLNDLFNGDRKKFKLAMAALLTAQGVPMLHEGQEFMKSKQGNDNSYDQDNAINWIDWKVKETNRDLYEFTRGLIRLRRKYECFKHTTPLTNQNIQWFQPGNHRAVGWLLKGVPNVMVLLNSDPGEWIQFDLPNNEPWTILCNGDKVADDGSLGTATGNYRVPPQTAVILKYPR